MWHCTKARFFLNNECISTGKKARKDLLKSFLTPFWCLILFLFFIIQNNTFIMTRVESTTSKTAWKNVLCYWIIVLPQEYCLDCITEAQLGRMRNKNKTLKTLYKMTLQRKSSLQVKWVALHSQFATLQKDRGGKKKKCICVWINEKWFCPEEEHVVLIGKQHFYRTSYKNFAQPIVKWKLKKEKSFHGCKPKKGTWTWINIYWTVSFAA